MFYRLLQFFDEDALGDLIHERISAPNLGQLDRGRHTHAFPINCFGKHSFEGVKRVVGVLWKTRNQNLRARCLLGPGKANCVRVVRTDSLDLYRSQTSGCDQTPTVSVVALGGRFWPWFFDQSQNGDEKSRSVGASWGRTSPEPYSLDFAISCDSIIRASPSNLFSVLPRQCVSSTLKSYQNTPLSLC
jgi:hypothetical protein